MTTPALAAAGAAAVSIPVAIHILSRMRRQPVNWGAMRFLQLAYRQQKNKMRLENWLLLMVRCLIALLLGLALSGPILTGCAGVLGGAFDQSGRVVHIVIDDSLSSAALETADATRLDRHVSSARAVIDAMEPSDRAALWLAGRPARALTGAPTLDREALGRALDGLTPRASASDLPGALDAVSQRLAEDAVPFDRAVVVVLSDLAAGADHWSLATPAALQGLGDRAQVLISEASTEVGNVQIASLVPRRTLVLSRSPDGGSAGSVSVSVALRRFAAGSEAAQAGVELRLIDAGGQVISTLRRDASWAAGQVEAVLNADLPLEENGREAQGPVAVEARLLPMAGALIDAVASDNVRLATVEARSALRVGLVDEADARDGISAGQFVSRALSPLLGAGSGMTLRTLGPSGLDGEVLDALDAVILLRPDMMPGVMWDELAAFARRGGLVWVMMPTSEGSAVWTDAMRRAFELDWTLGLDPFDLAQATGGLPLDTQKSAPEALELIGANWPELLRPVRVSRKLELLVPSDEAWLALADGVLTDDPGDATPTQPATGGTRRALLAARPIGDGVVLLMASALDAQWTNLPTKPLFVPLLHETLRGVLGSSPRGIVTAAAGDQPLLAAGWRDAVRLSPVARGDQTAAADEPITIRPVGDELRSPAEALDHPGLYIGLDGGDQPIGTLLALNADAPAGDTRPATDQQITQWFLGLGPWETLRLTGLSEQLAARALRPNIGWALLWVVLALVLIETILARTASHAKRETGEGLGSRVLGSLRHLRDEPGRADQTAANTTGRAA